MKNSIVYIYDSMIDELFELKEYNVNTPAESINVLGCWSPVELIQFEKILDFKAINRNGLNIELRNLHIANISDRFLILG